MAKNYKRKKHNTKAFEFVFFGLIALLAIVLVWQLVTPKPQPVDSTELYISDDGHVHLADGSHIGSVEEMFGDVEYEVTEDGHVHTKDGIHIGTHLPAAPDAQ